MKCVYFNRENRKTIATKRVKYSQLSKQFAPTLQYLAPNASLVFGSAIAQLSVFVVSNASRTEITLGERNAPLALSFALGVVCQYIGYLRERVH
jgi:hypothetical protein